MYRQYEGIKTNEIRAKRQSHGLDKDREWDIWRDGCEDGEYVSFCIFAGLQNIDTLAGHQTK